MPFRRLCPARLNFAALVVGSMSPDFGHYVRQFPVAQFAHTFFGTINICLPTGLLALEGFYALRLPLCFILPQPHRAVLMPLALIPLRLDLRNFLIAAMSILLGAWTHTFWDSFTHDSGWSVRHISVLRAPLVRVGHTVLSVSYVLQQLSTFGAGAVLALMYALWLRRQPVPPLSTRNSLSDRWRYLLLGSLAVAAFAIAAPLAIRMASLFNGYTAFRVFLFRFGIYSSAIFFPLLVLTSVVLFSANKQRAQTG